MYLCIAFENRACAKALFYTLFILFIMITYRLIQNNKEGSPTSGKWYARALHQMVTFDEFVEHMAAHHCVFSEATVKGVLIEMQTCLREMLLEGKAVRFDDLGIFRIGLKTKPADEPGEFNAKENVVGARLNLYLGKRFKAAGLRKDMRLCETPKNAVEE